jgi:hypothetical protein
MIFFFQGISMNAMTEASQKKKPKSDRYLKDSNFSTDQKLCFFGDTGDKNTFDLQQRVALDLQQNSSHCSQKIAIMHHPWKTRKDFDRSKGSYYKEGDDFDLLMKNHIIGKFDAVITGHDHYLHYWGEEKGTLIFITGAGGKTDALDPSIASIPFLPAPGSYDENTNGYLVLQNSTFRFHSLTKDNAFSIKWEKRVKCSNYQDILMHKQIL